MEDFTIINRVEKKEFVKASYARMYKNPLMIIATLLGAYYFLTGASDVLLNEDVHFTDRMGQLVGGWALLMMPIMLVTLASRQFDANKKLQQDVTYTFGEKGVLSVGPTHRFEYTWDHVVKLGEQGRYLLLYHNANSANFIDKTLLTQEQLEFIRSKVPQRRNESPGEP